MRRFIFLYPLLTALLLIGCQGQRGKIQSKVEEFLDATVADGYDYDIERYDNWDSTFSVSQESVEANHAYADTVAHFKKGITYQPYKAGDKLIYVGVKYKVTRDGSEPADCKQTVYMDKDLNGIVCVKEN